MIILNFTYMYEKFSIKNTIVFIVIFFTIAFIHNFLSNSNFTVIFEGRPIITNIADGQANTLKHESMHLIWYNLTPEQRIREIEYIKKQDFLGKNAYEYIVSDIIWDDLIYNFQKLFRPEVIDEEVFAYYWQMRL